MISAVTGLDIFPLKSNVALHFEFVVRNVYQNLAFFG